MQNVYVSLKNGELRKQYTAKSPCSVRKREENQALFVVVTAGILQNAGAERSVVIPLLQLIAVTSPGFHLFLYFPCSILFSSNCTGQSRQQFVLIHGLGGAAD